MSSSSNPPSVDTPRPAAPSGGKGKDFARMSSSAAAAAAASLASSGAPNPAPAPPAVESPSPVKKGKDLSRMVCAPPATTTTLDAPAVDVAPLGRPKGKDLSRMGSLPRGSPASVGGQSVAVAVETVAAPSSVGVSLGKANLRRPPSIQPPTPQIDAPPPTAPLPSPSPSNAPSAIDSAEHQRRQMIARAAAGLPTQPDDASKPLPPGADPHSLPNPSNSISPENQPTPRPSWSEAKLSTSSQHSLDASKSTTDPNYGHASQAPVLGPKLQALCRSIDPSYVLDAHVQEALLEMADSFLDKVTSDAVRLARHRGSNTLDVVDVALALKKGYGMEVPGLGAPSCGGAGKKGSLVGGWLFKDKLNVWGEEEKKGGRKKQKKG